MLDKRFLVLAITVLCAAFGMRGGWLFAQPSVPFDFIIGAGMHMQFIDGEEPSIIMRARDDKRNYAFDGYMQARYNYEGLAGVDCRIEYGGGPDSSLFFRNYAFFLWGRFFNNQLYMRGGYLTGDVWGGGGAQDFLKEGLGYEVNITPSIIKGLRFGVNMQMYNGALKLDEYKYITGFTYLLDGIFDLRFSYCNMYIAGRPGGHTATGGGDGAGGKGMITGYLELWPLKGLSMNFSAMVPDIMQANGKPRPELYQELAYTVKGWSFGFDSAWYNVNGEGLDPLTIHQDRKREELVNLNVDRYNPDNNFGLNAGIFVSKGVGSIWKFGTFTPRLRFRADYILQPEIRRYGVGLTSPIVNRAAAREIEIGYDFSIFEKDIVRDRWYFDRNSTSGTVARYRHDVWLVFMWRI